MTLNANYTNRASALAATRRNGRLRHGLVRLATVASAGLLATAVACKDSNVPYLINPTSISNSQVGVQNAVTGLFGASRNDVGLYVIFMSTFARDAANFVNTEPRWVTMGAGVIPISPSDQFLPFSVWDFEFRTAKFANSIITSLPNIAPPYTTPQAQAITGIAQTMKALNFMMLAETRDTLGVSVASITSTGTAPAPVLCNKDVWAYIVALLDSGNAALGAAGSVALPVTLPPGFSSVSAAAAPSTTPGSFAAFNRALAGKAGLELAYAIARGTGAGPTPTSAGSPNISALTRADSALRASALFSPANITPPATSGFVTSDPFGVYDAFSPQSGDLVNPINGNLGTLAVFWDLVADVDTAHDLRWKTKFSGNTNLPVQQPSFSGAASPFSYSYYSTPSSPIPIVRNEELTLVEAQIELGLGNLPAAITLINDVHTGAGGFGGPLAIAPTYTAVRDSLMKEQRISTALEGSEDRTIAIRMYGLEAVSDTTWDATSGPDATAKATAQKAEGPFQDQHTTVLPPPSTEVDGRGGSYTLTCSS